MACYSHISIGDGCGSYSVRIMECESKKCFILKIVKDWETQNPSYNNVDNCFSEFQNGHKRGGR